MKPIPTGSRLNILLLVLCTFHFHQISSIKHKHLNFFPGECCVEALFCVKYELGILALATCLPAHNVYIDCALDTL